MSYEGSRMLSSVNWAQSVSGAGISTGTFTYSDQASTRGQLLGAPSYLPPLTGIRALAALLVLGFHLEQQLPSGLFSFLPFLSHGDLGVDFFFILSGFIITHVYLASLASPSWGAIRVFFWHRFIRLYPVHIAVLAGLVVMVLVAGSAGNDLNHPQLWGWQDLFWQVTLLHAWGAPSVNGWNPPSWSISAEWFAYLTFPLLAPALLRVQERRTALVIAVAALGVTSLLLMSSLNVWAPSLVLVFGEFVCGAALCRAVTVGKALPRLSGDTLGTVAFAAFLVGASTDVAYFALVSLLALTILGAAMSRGFLAQILGSRPLVWLGTVSYSVYMTHFTVLILMRRLLARLGFIEWNMAAKFSAVLLTVALVLVVAAIVFYVIERPARTFLRNQMAEAK